MWITLKVDRVVASYGCGVWIPDETIVVVDLSGDEWRDWLRLLAGVVVGFRGSDR